MPHVYATVHERRSQTTVRTPRVLLHTHTTVDYRSGDTCATAHVCRSTTDRTPRALATRGHTCPHVHRTRPTHNLRGLSPVVILHPSEEDEVTAMVSDEEVVSRAIIEMNDDENVDGDRAEEKGTDYWTLFTIEEQLKALEIVKSLLEKATSFLQKFDSRVVGSSVVYVSRRRIAQSRRR